ncbi:MAG: transcriptional regulator [Clostridiales bacterium]|nr:transcriptional regulator [Clostridiales bacterium]
MKLVIAIINNDDSAVVSSALTKEGYIVTKLSTTGGFLMVGNTTLLIGSSDENVGHVKEIIKKNAQTRRHVRPTTMSFGVGLHDSEPGTEVNVGGATVFVLSVDELEKY